MGRLVVGDYLTKPEGHSAPYVITVSVSVDQPRWFEAPGPYAGGHHLAVGNITTTVDSNHTVVAENQSESSIGPVVAVDENAVSNLLESFCIHEAAS